MNEVENEDLVFTLETIVDKFGEEMAPYALGLCQNLVCFTPGVLFDAVVSLMCFDKLCPVSWARYPLCCQLWLPSFILVFYFTEFLIVCYCRQLHFGSVWSHQRQLMMRMIQGLWQQLVASVPLALFWSLSADCLICSLWWSQHFYLSCRGCWPQMGKVGFLNFLNAQLTGSLLHIM
jgi:hypothetical protein